MSDDVADEVLALVRTLRGVLEAQARNGVQGLPARSSRKRAAGKPAVVAVGSVGAPAPGVAPVPAFAVRAPEEPTPLPPRGAGAPVAAQALALVREELGDCPRCRLCETRQNIVFGVGNPEAHLVFVGEAPGADEDAQGEPFVGKAGQLLTRMIEAMGYRREEVYICNVIKCRPPGNRNPEPDEVAACEPFLKRQLAAIKPRMIVALGKFAAQCLLRDETPISRLRGNFRTYEGIQLMPTFHPAYLLRDPSKKKEAWQDLKQVLEALRRMGFEPPRPPAAGA